MMKILVTGAAGFIGFHLSNKLIKEGYEVFGLDSINDYYDPSLKYARLSQLGFSERTIENNKLITSNRNPNFKFIKLALEDTKNLNNFFRTNKFDAVCNLAAQAGVRYSIKNPEAYIDSNVHGFLNILECCRKYKIENFTFASSSSVYGLNEDYPFSEHKNADHPVSLYGATKRANELMAHSYSALYGIRATGLRFFTVYGPWGRPDMALFLFTDAALKGELVNVFNEGKMIRDFTYIDDIINGLLKAINNPAEKDLGWNPKNHLPSSSSAPFRIYNIGNNAPVLLEDFIIAIENSIEKKIKKKYLPIQPGDLKQTHADVSYITNELGYTPTTPLEEGIKKFVKWFREYYEI